MKLPCKIIAAAIAGSLLGCTLGWFVVTKLWYDEFTTTYNQPAIVYPAEDAIPKIEEPAVEVKIEESIPTESYTPNAGYSEPQREAATEYTMIVEATAYWTHDPVDASGTGLAADGNPAIAYRTIAVDPNVIPWYSEVYVPGIGWCIAHDTGSAINQNIIDIAMPSREAAFQWGRRTIEVIVRPPTE